MNVSREELSHANSGLNAVLRLGDPIGTALLAVVLGAQLTTSEGGGASRTAALEQFGRAFGRTLSGSLLLIALVLVAALLSPKPAEMVKQ